MRRLLARVIVPDEGSSCPIRMRNRVVLPIPLGPTSASRAPFATVNETPANRSSAPKDLEREFTVISDIVNRLQFEMPPNYKAGWRLLYSLDVKFYFVIKIHVCNHTI